MSSLAILQNEYAKRHSLNSRYSMRAFAAFLKIPSGRLSEIFSGKRKLSTTNAYRIADRLALSPGQKALLLDEAQNPSASRNFDQQTYRLLDDDQFRVIEDWQHFAILNLIKLRDFDSSPKWVSRRLGISKIVAEDSVRRLVRVGLLKVRPDGSWERLHRAVKTTDGIDSLALKRSHRQSLEQAIECLDRPVTERDVTSITFALNRCDIEKMKTKIKHFRRRFAADFGTNEGDEVYNLNIQLVPVTQQGENK